MNMSPKKLMKLFFVVPFVILLTLSIVLMVMPPYDANTVGGIVLLIVLFVTIVLGRKSLVGWFRSDGFRTSVKN